MTIVAPRYLFHALYAAAGLVLADQLAEVLATLYPFDLRAVQWRFGAYGLIVGRATTAVVIDALVVLAALGLGHRRVLRAWGIAHAVAAPLLLMGLAVFLLDSLELRSAAEAELARAMTSAAVRSVAIVVLAVVYCGFVLAATFRATARPPGLPRAADKSVLVAGS
jgi:hypothetical protein